MDSAGSGQSSTRPVGNARGGARPPVTPASDFSAWMNPVRNPRVADTAPAPISAQTSTAGISMEATRNLESFGTSVERVRQSGPREPPVRRPLPVKGQYYTKQQGIDFVEECLKSQPKTDEDFEKLADALFLKNGSTKNGKQLKTKWRAYEAKHNGTKAQQIPKHHDWEQRIAPNLRQMPDSDEQNNWNMKVTMDFIASMNKRSEAIKAAEEARKLEAQAAETTAKARLREAENWAREIENQKEIGNLVFAFLKKSM